jgi:hypothetical protein
MTVTGIFTTTKTTLTIATMQDVLLEKKGDDGPPQKLTSGIPTDITIGSGVFRLISNTCVRVSSNTPNLHVVTFDKQGDPIEFAKLEKILPSGFADPDLIDFFGLKSKSFP